MQTLESLLLSEQLIQVQNGVYDGGGGLSEPLLKKKVGDEINHATLLGQDIIDHEISSTKGKCELQVPAKSGCQPPRRKKSIEKMFVNRMETVRKLKFSMKVIKIHHRYNIENSEKSHTSYNCHIGLQPSCSCSDYAFNGSDVLCKHILFVLYFGLNVRFRFT